MVRRTTFLVLSLIAVLFLPFADCMSPMTQDQQSMQCCGSMPCDPSNQSHDCCKTMVSSQSASALPVAHVTLHAPATVPGYSAVAASPPHFRVFARCFRSFRAFTARAVHA